MIAETEYRIRRGGLMRCCIASIYDAMDTAVDIPKEGDVLKCKYCSDKLGMRFHNGAWEWARNEGQEALKNTHD